ncbi:PcfJ domain-containing protein [uncultured Bacteroides sp.]|uniref:PcfJ domain-containing protein n=1 Tax=uncultured Bacteroides sp. TaxID=162156 RepID=UPI002AAC209E|nr:PcfJ domain-containing protein [uncultured Bacteroides sp.]
MEIERMKHDYVRLLRHFGHDVSEKITYPKNLKAEYRILLNREKVEKIERKKKELEEIEINYQKFIEPLSDLEIHDKLINIVPLRSINEFKEEGTVLDHCVYSNEYFKKINCLILSSRIGEEHIETIEIDLKQMRIIQCRGKSNQSSSYHDRIIGLANKYMNLIRQRLTTQNMLPTSMSIAK